MGTWCELLDLARLWSEAGLVNGQVDMQTAHSRSALQLPVFAGGNTFRAWAEEVSTLS